MKKMKRKKFIARTAAASLAISMLVSSVSCGNSKSEKNMRIAVIGKMSLDFWDQVQNGAEDAGEELGFDVMYDCGDNDNDFTHQRDYIDKAIENKCSAIIIAPNSPTELNDQLKKAHDANIHIININSKAEYENVEMFIASSDMDAGKIAAREAAKKLKEAKNSISGIGKIAIIGHSAATAENRIAGFKEEFENQLSSEIAVKSQVHGSYPPSSSGDVSSDENSDKSTDVVNDGSSLKIDDNYFVQSPPCSSLADAQSEFIEILQKNSDISVVFSTNTNTTLAVCQEIEKLLSDSPRSDKEKDIKLSKDQLNNLVVIGFNAEESETAFIKSGILDGTVMQNPYNMGYIAVRYAKKILEDENVPDSLDTGVTFIDNNNINDNYIDMLLYHDINAISSGAGYDNADESDESENAE